MDFLTRNASESPWTRLHHTTSDSYIKIVLTDSADSTDPRATAKRECRPDIFLITSEALRPACRIIMSINSGRVGQMKIFRCIILEL